MAQYATIREVQARISSLVKTARTGEPWIVTHHGKPVAVLAAVEAEQADQLVLLLERRASYQAYRALQAAAAARPALPPPAVTRLIKHVRAQACRAS